MKAFAVAETKPVQPPNLAVEVKETWPTPYKRIQHKQEQRKAKKVQWEEKGKFSDSTIGVVKDKHTEMAKAEDNPCPFKEAVDKKDVLQPWQKRSIVQSAKNISYLIGQKFCQASKLSDTVLTAI